MLVNTNEAASVILRRAQDATMVVYDAETSGLDWKRSHIVGHVLTFGSGSEDTFYVPVRHAEGKNLPDSNCQVPSGALNWAGSLHWFEKELKPILENRLVIGHNLSFDLKFLHRININPPKVACTMVAAYLTNELRNSMSLDACCKDEKVQAKMGTELYQHLHSKFGCANDKTAMALFWRADPGQPVVHEYAAGDGTSTYQLWSVLRKQLTEPYYENANGSYSLQKVANVEFDLIPVLNRMSIKGIKTDEERLDYVAAKVVADCEKAMEAIGGINVRSPLQVRGYLEKMGVTNWPLTEAGAPSFPEEWLLTSEAGKQIVTVRKSRTLNDSYLKPIKEQYLFNGRVFVEFHQTRDTEFGTRTGRMSTTGPNLGAMPGKRQGDLGRMFRSIFVPDEGMEFTEADYMNCEIRICAHYCQAKTWVDGYKRGVDPHTSVAADVGISRRFAKTINLALMTGSGKKAIAQKLGLPYDEASRMIDVYFAGLPELKDFQKKSAAVFRSRGFISTILGRRLQLIDSNKDYTAVNRLTQGGNADLCKAAMVAMDKAVPGALALTVYDSALFQHEKGDEATKQAVLQAMVKTSDLLGFSVPMGVEYGSGKDWGEATFTVNGSIDPAKEAE